MPRLSLCFLLAIMFKVSCATSMPTDPGKDSASGPVFPAESTPEAGDSQEKTTVKTSVKTSATLDCVRAMNEFGQPRSCRCQPDLKYNQITGTCERQGRICTQALVEMFDEKTSRCFMAPNGCVASDLKSIGWRVRTSQDACRVD